MSSGYSYKMASQTTFLSIESKLFVQSPETYGGRGFLREPTKPLPLPSAETANHSALRPRKQRSSKHCTHSIFYIACAYFSMMSRTLIFLFLFYCFTASFHFRQKRNIF